MNGRGGGNRNDSRALIKVAAAKPLYGYQGGALEEARGHVREGRRKVLIVMPTGGGKTRTAAEAVRVHIMEGGHVLWCAHRRELIKQGRDTLVEYGLRVGAFGLDAAAPVQVQSIQALTHPNRRTAPPASLLIVDEAHHLLAEEWRKLAETYEDCLLLGLTATPARSDGQALGDVFNAMVVAAQVRDLIALNDQDDRVGLVRCAIQRPTDDDGVSARVLRSDEVARHPVEAYQLWAGGQRAVLFAPNVKAAKAFTQAFNAAGIRAEFVESKTPKDERDSILTLFRRGEIRVVVNVNVLTEGWDDPECSVCIIARGCDHASLYIQMVGRVMRAFPGKKRALLIDLRGISWIHGSPMADRKYDLFGDPIVVDEVEEEKACPWCSRIIEGKKCTNPDCQRAAASREMMTPHSVDAKMALFDENDPREDDTQSAKVAKLAQWVRDTLASGASIQSAFKKFEAAYGYFPRHERRDALLLAHAKDESGDPRNLLPPGPITIP
jgi:superfamily II DNA or RNA helicase